MFQLSKFSKDSKETKDKDPYSNRTILCNLNLTS